jgi:hypothetical protein
VDNAVRPAPAGLAQPDARLLPDRAPLRLGDHDPGRGSHLPRPPAAASHPTGRLILPADADRDAWLTARRGGLGSSDIAAILGISRYGNALSVWHDKTGGLPLESDDSEPALWGRHRGDGIAREWARRNRSVVRRVGLVANIDRPWQMCTLDRRVLECPLADRPRTVRRRGQVPRQDEGRPVPQGRR